MKKIIFGIFAHPDDEAFGPSGTLMRLRSEGYDIHFILLTDGEAGVNIDHVPDLAATRLAEWQESTKLLGARSTHALHYPDGELENVSSTKLDEAAHEIIAKTFKTYTDLVELSFMSFEPNGLTSHRDHIAASQLTTRMTRAFSAHAVWYFCHDSTQAALKDTAYYEPRAREENYITTRIDVSPWLDQKYHIMDAHYSQRNDAVLFKRISTSKESFHIEIY